MMHDGIDDNDGKDARETAFQENVLPSLKIHKAILWRHTDIDPTKASYLRQDVHSLARGQCGKISVTELGSAV